MNAVPSLYNYLPCGDPLVCREPWYPTAPNQKWQGRFSTAAHNCKGEKPPPRRPGCRCETGGGTCDTGGGGYGMGHGFFGDPSDPMNPGGPQYYDPGLSPNDPQQYNPGGPPQPPQQYNPGTGQHTMPGGFPDAQVIDLPGGGQTWVPVGMSPGFSPGASTIGPSGSPQLPVPDGIDAAVCDKMRKAGADAKASGSDYASAWAQVEAVMMNSPYFAGSIDQIKACYDQGYGTPGTTEDEGLLVDAAMCDEFRKAGATSKAAGVEFATAWAQVEALVKQGQYAGSVDQLKVCYAQGYDPGGAPPGPGEVTPQLCEDFRKAGQANAKSGINYAAAWTKVREAAFKSGYGDSIDYLKACYDKGYNAGDPGKDPNAWADTVVTAELCEIYRSSGEQAKEAGIDHDEALQFIWSGMSKDIIAEANGDRDAVGAVQARLLICFDGGYQGTDATEKKSSSGWVLAGAAAVAFGGLLLLGALGQPASTQ